MSRGLNEYRAIGNVSMDPVMREYTKGAMLTFRMAVPIGKTGTKTDKATFINCVMFSPLCTVAYKLLQKGSRLFIAGTINNRSYEKDGRRAWTTEIVIDDFILLGSIQGDAIAQESSGGDSDDVPF